MEEITKRVTKEQKYMLIQYLEEHREFAHDRFVNSAGAKSLAEQWDALAEKLNALGGALKNGENWKKAWTNMRSKAKQKFQDYKNMLERSGINGAQKNKLTDLDERVVGIMSKESVVGQEEVSEPLRSAGIVADVSFVAENDGPAPSCSAGTGTKNLLNARFEERKRKQRHIGAEMLELEQQFLQEKRRKNDIAEAQVKALNSINKTLLDLVRRGQN